MPSCQESIPLPPYIRLQLAEVPSSLGGSISLTKQDLQKLPCVALTIRAFLALLPSSVEWRCDLVGAEVRLYLTLALGESIAATAEEFTADLVRALEITAEQLAANAASARPLPESKAVSQPNIIPVLKALHSAHGKSALEVTLVTSLGEFPLPVPKASDFTCGAVEQAVRQSRVLPVVGLRRDDRSGHKLILSEDEIVVRLPANDRWTWAAIKDVLNTETWFEGTLIRRTPRDPWEAGDDVILRSQADAFATLGS